MTKKYDDLYEENKKPLGTDILKDKKSKKKTTKKKTVPKIKTNDIKTYSDSSEQIINFLEGIVNITLRNPKQISQGDLAKIRDHCDKIKSMLGE